MDTQCTKQNFKPKTAKFIFENDNHDNEDIFKYFETNEISLVLDEDIDNNIWDRYYNVKYVTDYKTFIIIEQFSNYFIDFFYYGHIEYHDHDDEDYYILNNRKKYHKILKKLILNVFGVNSIMKDKFQIEFIPLAHRFKNDCKFMVSIFDKQFQYLRINLI